MNPTTFSADDRQELVDVFVAEADDLLDQIEQALLGLEQSPENDELLHEIFRGVHTIKGNASCLNFEELAWFAHVMEELLDGMRAGRIEANAAHVSQLLDAVDVLRDLAARSVHGDGALSATQEELLRRLAHWAASSDIVISSTGNAAEAPNSASPVSRTARTLRVGIDRLDHMLNLAGEIAIARSNVRQLVESTNGDEKTLDAIRELDRLSFDLQESVMRVRLVPVGPALRHFHRIVRDLAASQHKRVMLVLEGEEVEVDTTLIEQLKDPITHMIRNSIDHGIELPEVRSAGGKAAVGTLRITTMHEAGGVVIRFSDDGAGLDDKRIAERARKMGLDPDRMTRQELRDLTLRAGFSTAREVTDLSGRGVGMDVVRRNVESLRGTLSIDSEPGFGTTIEIRLPLTVAVLDGFGVGVGEETFVIPMDSILECVEMPEGLNEATGIIDLHGEPLPFLRIQKIFELEARSGARENVVVVEGRRGRAGIVVDALHGSSQTVMKPMGRYLRQIPGVAGSAILGNGRVALILDVHEIIHKAVIAGAQTSSQGAA